MVGHCGLNRGNTHKNGFKNERNMVEHRGLDLRNTHKEVLEKWANNSEKYG